MTQYLMKAGTNRILIATPELLNRKANDMILVDPEIIKTRIEATKRQLEAAKAVLASRQIGSIPEEVKEGATALHNLQTELAEVNKSIQDLAKGDTPEAEKKPETTEDMNKQAFAELVENDKEIQTIKGKRKVDSMKEFIEINYGIKEESEDLDVLKEKAIALRTEILRQQFNK